MLCNGRVKGESTMDGKCQAMEAVYDCCETSPEPRQIYFGLPEKNGRKGIKTIKSHSITNNIHMRQLFQVMCGICRKV